MPKGIYLRTEKTRKNISIALTGKKQQKRQKRKEL